jgi:hypothetical protein
MPATVLTSHASITQGATHPCAGIAQADSQQFCLTDRS